MSHKKEERLGFAMGGGVSLGAYSVNDKGQDIIEFKLHFRYPVRGKKSKRRMMHIF